MNHRSHLTMSPQTPLLLFFVLLSHLLLQSTIASTPFQSSRAVYSNSFNTRGACGYFEYGANVNKGNVAAVGRLYGNGAGCGACYLVRCTEKRLCDEHGLNVVVTDYGGSGAGVDFILSSQAFAGLAKSGCKSQLMGLGVVDVEYRRIPCLYPGRNLVIRIMENSIYPDYLAVTFLYQGGKHTISAVEVSRWCYKWVAMRHAYGSVWDLATAPKGPLNLRFLIISDSGEQRWVEMSNVIPVGWNRGDEYDTGLQLNRFPKSGVSDEMHFRCKETQNP